jgi:hypothetical protein
VTRSDGAEFGYEQTLEALQGLIGRPVLVPFSGTHGSPFVSGILSGRLDRGELDERRAIQVVVPGELGRALER